MLVKIEENYRSLNSPESLGVVTDTAFIRCHWPRPDQPLKVFAEGSRGLYVEGPPAIRNCVFPPDTRFRESTARIYFVKVDGVLYEATEAQARVLADGGEVPANELARIDEDAE